MAHLTGSRLGGNLTAELHNRSTYIRAYIKLRALNINMVGAVACSLAMTNSDLFGLAWRGSEVKSAPMLQSGSTAPYLNRNNCYPYRLARHFRSN